MRKPTKEKPGEERPRAVAEVGPGKLVRSVSGGGSTYLPALMIDMLLVWVILCHLL